jgi:hypothetical protein
MKRMVPLYKSGAAGKNVLAVSDERKSSYGWNYDFGGKKREQMDNIA